MLSDLAAAQQLCAACDARSSGSPGCWTSVSLCQQGLLAEYPLGSLLSYKACLSAEECEAGVWHTYNSFSLLVSLADFYNAISKYHLTDSPRKYLLFCKKSTFTSLCFVAPLIAQSSMCRIGNTDEQTVQLLFSCIPNDRTICLVLWGVVVLQNECSAAKSSIFALNARKLQLL